MKLSVPRDSLSGGLQLVGRLHDDLRVLRAARAYETARPFPFPRIKAK